MAIDTQAPMSRRGLLAAVVGGAAAAVAGTVGRAERAWAAGSDGETVVVGGAYDDVRSTTRFTNAANDDPFLRFVTPDDVTPEFRRVVEIGGVDADIRVSFNGFRHGGEVTISNLGVRASAGGAASNPAGATIVGSGDRGGVLGNAPEGAGVEGVGRTGVKGVGRTGVRGSGGRGGEFSGRRAQIRMEPSKEGTHPTRGKRGDFFVDQSGRLWYCKGNTRWQQLA